MGSPVLTEVGQDKERVLVDLVRVLWRVACLRGKSELSDAVIELLVSLSWLHSVLMVVGSGHLFRDRGSHICAGVRTLIATVSLALLALTGVLALQTGLVLSLRSTVTLFGLGGALVSTTTS